MQIPSVWVTNNILPISINIVFEEQIIRMKLQAHCIYIFLNNYCIDEIRDKTDYFRTLLAVN